MCHTWSVGGGHQLPPEVLPEGQPLAAKLWLLQPLPGVHGAQREREARLLRLY